MAVTTHVAHFNYGVMIAPIGDPRVAEFVDRIPLVHVAAERSKGFVWRFPGDEATSAEEVGRPIGSASEPIICSFSVWQTVENFETFLHKTVHGHFLHRRETWFVPGRSEMVLWHVTPGHIPDIHEALDRLEEIRRDGPGDALFTLSSWKAAQH